MTTLADLHKAVKAALSTKRLGQPVFVRYLFQGQDDANAILPRLAGLAAIIQDWLGQPWERIYAVGSPANGQVTLTLEGKAGATALVSYARGSKLDEAVDLTVLGNHGALYHTLGPMILRETGSAAANEKILAAAEKSLRTGKPEAPSMGGGE